MGSDKFLGWFPWRSADVLAIFRVAVLIALAVLALACDGAVVGALGGAAASSGDVVAGAGDAAASSDGAAACSCLVGGRLAGGAVAASDPGPIEDRVRALREVSVGVRGGETKSPDPKREVRH